MYGAHHRVAPLRGSGAGAGRHSVATPCDTLSATPTASQRELLTQRGSQVGCGAASWPSTTGTYALPISMQRSHLTAPVASQPLRTSQFGIPHTQPQVGDGALLQSALSQTAQHQKEATAALLTVVDSLQQQERRLADGCQSLSYLATLVDGQHAQVAALRSLAEEVRAMVVAIRDAAAVLHGVRRQDTPPAAGSTPFPDMSHWQKSAVGLVLGDDSLSPPPHVGDGNGGSSKKSGDDDDGFDGGAAYMGGSQVKRVVLRGTAASTRRAAKMQFIEDDVFSM